MKKTILFLSLLWAVNCGAQGKWQGYDLGYYYSEVKAMCADSINNTIYIGIRYARTDSNHKDETQLLKGDGNTWDSVFNPSFKNGYISALTIYHGKVYLGMTASGNNSGNGEGAVLSYDGNSPTFIGYFNGGITCLNVYHDTLFAGGYFYQDTLGDQLYGIAKWNSTKWLPVDSGIGANYICCSIVTAMTVYNNQLIVGGYFDWAGNNTAHNIIAYDGNNWHTLQNGVGDTSNSSSDQVNALDVYNGRLYVGGDFFLVNGSLSTNEIASWDGNKWDSVPNQIAAQPNALKAFDNYLFIGGLAGLGDETIFKYDGKQISTVDSGTLGGYVAVINSLKHSLYVGGQFGYVGKTIISQGIARWTPDAYTGVKQLPVKNNQLSISPNPFSQQTTLQFSQPTTNNTQLTLYDLTGRKVENYFIARGVKNFIIKRNNLPAGMFFYKVTGNDTPEITGKIVIE